MQIRKVARFFLLPLGAALFVARLSTASFAADPTPCEQIQRACGEAGFTRDLPEGRDLMSKCFKPILLGQEIPGVKVDSDLVKKCNESQSAKPKGRRQRH